MRFSFMLISCILPFLANGAILAKEAQADAVPSVLAPAAKGRTILDFASPLAKKQWQAVNDDIMGGESISTATITADLHMLFSGTLSLDNHGGFASLRSQPSPLGLAKDSVIVVRLRGDGRTYTLSLWTKGPLANYVESAQRNETGIADLMNFRTTLTTTKGQWIEHEFPMSSFIANVMGQEMPGAGLDKPETISSVGIGLNDKKSGPFSLEIASLSVR